MPKFQSFVHFFTFIRFTVLYLIRFCIESLFISKYKCIKDDLILVTGGSKGIGRKIAVELGKHAPKKVSKMSFIDKIEIVISD